MKLFIDDIRVPSDVGLINSEWTIARNYKPAIDLIKVYKPQEISFDHDLGDFANGREITGYDILSKLIEMDMDTNGDFINDDFKLGVHSANPVGKKNIEMLFEGYITYKEGVKNNA